jgi:hypothetical protein
MALGCQIFWILIMIKIDFEFDTPNGIFKDAIHLPENHELSEIDITALKQQRLDNWLAIVNPAPVEGE